MAIDTAYQLNLTPKLLAACSATVPAVLYVLWVLASVVGWVSHLGNRVPVMGMLLASGGAPDFSRSVPNPLQFLMSNLMLAAAFVLPHSLLRPQRIKAWVGVRFAKLTYNVMAAASLHLFLAFFAPLETPVLFNLPIPSEAHACLSVGALVLAFWALLTEPRTYFLLGVYDALDLQVGADKRTVPGMDIITWQGLCVYERFGALGFVMFSGLSILPLEVTVSDIVVRIPAAIYLRYRSKSFREWIGRIETIHVVTWFLRGGLMLGALTRGSASMGEKLTSWRHWGVHDVSLLCAAATSVPVLRHFER
eukprot:TRINITY_DN6686_c0_g1_i1.p1 TRINITY_DN6686_c0_g1~~TRINITY_DN6686_c0_g1_i1.p1  ORF type:complete len:307 (+),score=25.10 TRINITY_DN6686_c0_g1_i1:211-1131(+)